MLGPVEDVTSITYQRLRQLIDAHVRPTAASSIIRLPSLCFPSHCVMSRQHHVEAGVAPVGSAGVLSQLGCSAGLLCTRRALPATLRGPDGAARAPRQREVMLHMSQTDAKMVSKIHCMLKKVAAPPGVWAKCLVRACAQP